MSSSLPPLSTFALNSKVVVFVIDAMVVPAGIPAPETFNPATILELAS